MTIIQCYAPTEAAELAAKEEFYNSLNSVLTNIRRGDIVMLMGDFNAQVGGDNTNLQNVMGTHGVGRLTENGKLLAETGSTHNLLIGGTLFPHKRIHKVTWISPDYHTENQIDHILISRKWRGSLLDVRTKRGADVGSDHHLLIATVRLKIASIKNDDKHSRKFDIERLKIREVATAFANPLRDALNNIPAEYRTSWSTVRDLYLTSAKNNIGYANSKRKPWISDETWTRLEDRKLAKEAINVAKTRNAKIEKTNEYNRLNREVKKSARTDKRKRIDSIATEAQRASETNRSRDLYKATKLLSNRPFTAVKPIRDDDGTLITAKNKQIAVWKGFYSELLSNDTANDTELQCNCESHSENQNMETDIPSINEAMGDDESNTNLYEYHGTEMEVDRAYTAEGSQ
ncbi:uncharacterized protein [Musca autumnalis]|uniref:uncharacterized protein n=1 Tax=Musca autumnalis TaxID=221902 RepID=UPI003CF15757